MSKRKRTLLTIPVENFDCDSELAEEDGFIEGDIDLSKFTVASTFSFANDTASLNTAAEQKQQEVTASDMPVLEKELLHNAAPEDNAHIKETLAYELIDNRKQQIQPYGITPPVEGEHFEISRTFKFRRSTVRMLNRLKAEQQNENVYLSTIIDEAIRHYYEYVFNGNEVLKETKQAR